MGSNWKGLLTRVKGPQKHMDKGVVYQIPSAQCNEVYIGETGRSLKTRITEHKRAVATDDDVRNANATHWMKTNYNMDWGQDMWWTGQTGRRGRSRKACRSGPGECTTWIKGLPLVQSETPSLGI